MTYTRHKAKKIPIYQNTRSSIDGTREKKREMRTRTQNIKNLTQQKKKREEDKRRRKPPITFIQYFCSHTRQTHLMRERARAKNFNQQCSIDNVLLLLAIMSILILRIWHTQAIHTHTHTVTHSLSLSLSLSLTNLFQFIHCKSFNPAEQLLWMYTHYSLNNDQSDHTQTKEAWQKNTSANRIHIYQKHMVEMVCVISRNVETNNQTMLEHYERIQRF